MKYLVDANILSEPTKPRPEPKVEAWLQSNEADLAVDAVILGELALGIYLLPRSRRRTRFEQWYEGVIQRITCLPWDAATSRVWAQLLADLKKKGRALPILDSMIAATALAHGLTIATRNLRDFQLAGVPVTNPFA